jgi:hypothetical protein
MRRNEATIGFRTHSGWAVAVAMVDGAPVLRRRIEMGKAKGFRSTQPYHAAEQMKLPEAEAFLQRTQEAALEMACGAIGALVAELEERGNRVRRASVLMGSGKPLPELARILAAHPLIHTAEGVFFREVLNTACGRCGLKAAAVKEREVPPELLARTSGMGKVLGRPWTQDEKLAAAAALLAARS